LTGGCVPLIPYEEIRARLSAESLVEVDGQLAHVVRSGGGEPIVLLHGFGASAYSWRHVTAALANDYESIAIDLNGFGYTERSRDVADYTVAGQLALVLGVLDALGIDTAHFAGHSYGGALATHLAWRFPERVRSLILVDSAGAAYPWERRQRSAANRPLTYLFVRTRAIKRDAVVTALEGSFADDSRISAELVDAYHERVRIEGVSRAFRGLTMPTREPRELPDLARLDLPVLLVWGAEDELTLPQAGREAAATLPQAEFHLLDGVGHIPPEEAPDELSMLMRAFLARFGTD
ncbi:MAG: alpha/beta fold hydrolase, partial [Thermoanaerobaculia bacterium]